MIEDFVKGAWCGILMLFHFGILLGSFFLPFFAATFILGGSKAAAPIGACIGFIFCAGVVKIYWEKYPI